MLRPRHNRCLLCLGSFGMITKGLLRRQSVVLLINLVGGLLIGRSHRDHEISVEISLKFMVIVERSYIGSGLE